MDAYTLVVYRRPKVKARPRHTKSGKVFTPASTLQEEDHIAAAWKTHIGKTISEPVEITVVYTPESTILHVTTSPHDARTLRGDLDNYVKLTLDALNGVAWIDDGQIVRIHAVKVDKVE